MYIKYSGGTSTFLDTSNDKGRMMNGTGLRPQYSAP